MCELITLRYYVNVYFLFKIFTVIIERVQRKKFLITDIELKIDFIVLINKDSNISNIFVYLFKCLSIRSSNFL